MILNMLYHYFYNLNILLKKNFYLFFRIKFLSFLYNKLYLNLLIINYSFIISKKIFSLLNLNYFSNYYIIYELLAIIAK